MAVSIRFDAQLPVEDRRHAESIGNHTLSTRAAARVTGLAGPGSLGDVCVAWCPFLPCLRGKLLARHRRLDA